MEAELRTRVEQATVTILKTPKRRKRFVPMAQGVLVPGSLILTAAHCVTWTEGGAMALGEPHFEVVETADGTRFAVEVVALEPVADVAILAVVDDQHAELGADFDAFQEWAARTSPVSLTAWEPRLQEISRDATGRPRISEPDSIAVHLLTHHKRWIDGRVVKLGTNWNQSPRLSQNMIEQIESGTSGGPIVDDAGRLVGVVSSDEVTAMLSMALPRWVWSRVSDAESRGTAEPSP